MINTSQLQEVLLSAKVMTADEETAFEVHQLSGTYVDDPSRTFGISVLCVKEI